MLCAIVGLLLATMALAALSSARDGTRRARATVQLRPASAAARIGKRHCVSATVRSGRRRAARRGARVLFFVAGANPVNGTTTTDGRGRARFCYRGARAGADMITAVLDLNGDRRAQVAEPRAVAGQTYFTGTRPSPPSGTAPDVGGPGENPPPLLGPDPVIAAAGDIASSSTGATATAALLDTVARDAVLALGDNAYSEGSALEYATRYAPTWGAQAFHTYPVAGNHDYDTPGAAGYFGYFGTAAGQPGTGYYSYDLGAWHLIALNSNCTEAGGCVAGSAQEQWLRADLAAHPAACTLAYWHHPLFSSGKHGSHTQVAPLWQALYEAGADVVLTAHDHDYERFAPQTATGVIDAERGLREFVVGTGGGSHYLISLPIANSEIANDDTFGILELTLRPASYDWRFIPEAAKTFADAGSAPCH